VNPGIPERSVRLADEDADEEERKVPPSRTPGQAEGPDEESEGSGTNPLPSRPRPSQAEGTDPDDEADNVPKED
jgi:hypothetical protein